MPTPAHLLPSPLQIAARARSPGHEPRHYGAVLAHIMLHADHVHVYYNRPPGSLSYCSWSGIDCEGCVERLAALSNACEQSV